MDKVVVEGLQNLKDPSFVEDGVRMVNVAIDGVAGKLPVDQLRREIGSIDNDNEYTEWVEYWREGVNVPVHRSVHVALKKPMVFAEGTAASFG